jgi:adenine phosphoribosyltransferase
LDRLTHIRDSIRDVSDFPKKGIIFKDITPVLQNKALFAEVIDILSESVRGNRVDQIAGIESRGFIFGAALSTILNVGFIPIRKPGKLPYKKYRKEYQLEYGTDALEIHQDAVSNSEHVLLIDDLLATGGTALAAAKLLEQCGGTVEKILFLIELEFLNGIDQLKEYNVQSLIKF